MVKKKRKTKVIRVDEEFYRLVKSMERKRKMPIARITEILAKELKEISKTPSLVLFKPKKKKKK